MKNGKGHKGKRTEEDRRVSIAIENWERWVGSALVSQYAKTKLLFQSNTTSGVLERARTLHQYGLQSGFLNYGMTTPTCSMPGVPYSTLGLTQDTQLSCSVGRAAWPQAIVLSAIRSPFMIILALKTESMDLVHWQDKCLLLFYNSLRVSHLMPHPG